MITTDILVIGGGATGLGVARDAALRGFKVVLLEKGDLAHGTSGRYHGLLHSGGRYVVRDPQSAAECYRENLILKRLLPSAIEDTGGFFISLHEDPPEYVQFFVDGCRVAGIPAEEISPVQALTAESLLNPNLVRAFRVPDAACDSFDALRLLAESVRAAGGEVLTRHKVIKCLSQNSRLAGVEAQNILTGERIAIQAEMVINCAGAWAGTMAALAGCKLKVLPAKGVMLALNLRVVNTVINRLKPPGDGDILVPVGTVAVMGTTEVRVKNPDHYLIDDEEIDLLLAEGEKLIPRFREFRALRAWAGVRPLFTSLPTPALPPLASLGGTGRATPPPSPAPIALERGEGLGVGGEVGSRLVSRAHVVIDHAARDGVEGFVSVVGGKFTTFRLMAEQTVDLVCQKLGTLRKCVTAEMPIDPPGKKFHTLGKRLDEIESAERAEIICECELVTRAQAEAELRRTGSPVLNDLRRALRLGMGPCQAGFCAYRAAGILHDLRPAGERGEVNSALRDFLQERWKGLRPVMWGANLRQLELDLNIYCNLLGVARVPFKHSPEEYPTEKTA